MQPTAAECTAHRDQDIVAMLGDAAYAAAFASLVDRYHTKIFRLCCSLLRDRGLAEDAAQESLLRIWTALARYDGRASLSTWIYAITRNRCLSALERRRQVLPTAAAPEPCAEEPGAGVGDDRGRLLRELVDALPDRYRQTLTLYYYEDKSIVETAGMLGIPEGTVKTNLYRARALLHEKIGALGLADPLVWLEDK